jgi:hypothetical protein
VFDLIEELTDEKATNTVTTPPPAMTPPTTATTTSTSTSTSSTSEATSVIVVFTTDTTQGDFDLIVSELVDGGGDITEQYTNPSIGFFEFFASLNLEQLMLLDKNSLVSAISLTGVVGTYNAEPLQQSYTSRKHENNFPTERETRSNLTTRALPANAIAETVALDNNELIDGLTFPPTSLPYHLLWLSSLYFKNNLPAGSCR